MLVWLRRNPEKTSRLASRVFEALREIGVLLIAFAPLDVAVNPYVSSGSRSPWPVALLFVAFGVFLLMIALALEWRYDK